MAKARSAVFEMSNSWVRTDETRNWLILVVACWCVMGLSLRQSDVSSSSNLISRSSSIPDNTKVVMALSDIPGPRVLQTAAFFYFFSSCFTRLFSCGIDSSLLYRVKTVIGLHFVAFHVFDFMHV